MEIFKDPRRRIGASYVEGEGVYLRVWAPEKEHLEVRWVGGDKFSLLKDKDGYFNGHFSEARPGDRYELIADGKTTPDPAARYQPDGVFSASEVVAFDYAWTDQVWRGVPYGEWVIYEIHTGTYSDRQDFQGIIDDLPRLKDLGVTVLEIMPVSQFPGSRNWGYDGVFPHSVQNSYGGPEKLKALVNACHAHGLAIILDVVYNHLGPEGNILPFMGPYFQSKYKTPWGDALNFDGPMSEDVRNYFLQTVWQWLTEYHFDGLRLDAVQTIFDTSPIPFLEELSRLKSMAEIERGYPLYVIAETDMNDSRLLAHPDLNGLGMDAHWADDLHHVLHVMLTGETESYYADYGGLDQLARTYRAGVAFEGEYSFTRHRCHGRSYSGIDKKRLVVETQNHDQIGNRIGGQRLNVLVDFEKIKLMAASIFLSPFTPLFFMGEEIGAENPFHYFVNHGSQELIDAIREGRHKEFDLSGEKIDPSSEELLLESLLKNKDHIAGEKSGAIYLLYKHLIGFSKEVRQYDYFVQQDDRQQQIILFYKREDSELRVILSFRDEPGSVLLKENESWKILLRTSDYQPGITEFGSELVQGSVPILPFSAMVLEKEG
jgi:maltooligosyltrehalose trehalohydrolase